MISKIYSIERSIKHLLFAAFTSLLLFFLSTAPLFAQGLDNPLAGRANNLLQLLELVLSAVIAISFPVVVLFIIYSGFLFITAQGNEQKLTEAKRYIIYTIIGALIVLGSYALSRAISATVCNIAPNTQGC